MYGMTDARTSGTYDSSGIEALAEALMLNGSLNILNLKGNFIGPDGAKALAAALTPSEQGRFNRSLNMLNLADNRLCGPFHLVQSIETPPEPLISQTHDPSGIEALAKALVLNESLTTINLRGNAITPEGAKALAAALDNRQSESDTFSKTLNLLGNKLGDEGTAAVLAIMRQGDAVTSVCGIAPNASEIKLRGGHCFSLTSEDAKLLAGELALHESLHTLDVSSNDRMLKDGEWLVEATDVGTSDLSNLGTVRAYQGSEYLIAGGIAAIRKNMTYDIDFIRALADALVLRGSLQTLNLKGNKIGPERAKVLAAALAPNEHGVFNMSLNTLILEGKNLHIVHLPSR
ncbi:hypothetical protein CYMTET_28065 [Cymbomonas tetramitiformis]|uniref:Uncharacterized protein n=1 Tax=Cymbomonas tetramitiformis TaxID=36881 RepID=A0AAE0FP48_9CHLO|nr:hypothetical protein CYMTET_28065 [Cymbomonas tetramitiformis]